MSLTTETTGGGQQLGSVQLLTLLCQASKKGVPAEWRPVLWSIQLTPPAWKELGVTRDASSRPTFAVRCEVKCRRLLLAPLGSSSHPLESLSRDGSGDSKKRAREAAARAVLDVLWAQYRTADGAGKEEIPQPKPESRIQVATGRRLGQKHAVADRPATALLKHADANRPATALLMDYTMRLAKPTFELSLGPSGRHMQYSAACTVFGRSFSEACAPNKQEARLLAAQKALEDLGGHLDEEVKKRKSVICILNEYCQQTFKPQYHSQVLLGAPRNSAGNTPVRVTCTVFDRSFAVDAATLKEGKLQSAAAALDAFMREEGEGGDAQHILEHGVAQVQPLNVKIEGLCRLLDSSNSNGGSSSSSSSAAAAASGRNATASELRMVRLVEERLRAICHEVAAMDFENLTPVTHSVAAFLQTSTSPAAAATSTATSAAGAASSGAPCNNETDVKVVSFASGGRKIEPANLTRDGRCLTDSHAEVLARRGLVRYLSLELARSRSHERGEPAGALSGPSSVFEGGRLRDGVRFHLYVSVIPCGDAKRFKAWSRRQEEEATVDEGSKKRKHSEIEGPKKKEKEQERMEEKHDPALEAFHCGQMCVKQRAGLRAFPTNETRDRTAHGCMSCSDKILKWTLGGLQGRALAAALPAPVRLSSVVIGSGGTTLGNLQRALCCRAPGGCSGLRVAMAPRPNEGTAVKKKSNELSANWILNGRGGCTEFTDAATGLLFRSSSGEPSRLSRASMTWMMTKETRILPTGQRGEMYSQWKARIERKAALEPPSLPGYKGTRWEHSCHLHDFSMGAAAEKPEGKEASIASGDQPLTLQSTKQSEDHPSNHHAQISSAVQQQEQQQEQQEEEEEEEEEEEVASAEAAAAEASRVPQSREAASSAPPVGLERVHGRLAASAIGMTLPAAINVEGAGRASATGVPLPANIKFEGADSRASVPVGMTLPAVLKVQGPDGASPPQSQTSARQDPAVKPDLVDSYPESAEATDDGVDAPGFIEIPPTD